MKVLKIVTTTLLIVVLVVASLFLARQCLSYLLGLDYLEKEEMTEVLMDNWDLLNETATELKPLLDDSIKIASITPGIWMLNMDCINLKHGLLLSAYDETKEKLTKDDFTNEELSTINNSKAYKVLRKWDFVEISYIKSDKNCLYFDNRSNLGFTVSLVYCESGQPQYKYISTCEHIVGNWYYCVTE